MSEPKFTPILRGALALIAAGMGTVLASCGGGGSNPIGNPPTVSNGSSTSSGTLSFAYYQRCINPIFLALLPTTANGVTTNNTCASSGCHDNATGTGGAFRVVPSAALVDLSNAANTPEVIRGSDMYKNYYSAQGEVVLGSVTQSRLLAKPMLLNVLHGGGLVFESEADANVKLIKYWINHPVPQGQNEFSAAANSMFTPADPSTGACNTE